MGKKKLTICQVPGVEKVVFYDTNFGLKIDCPQNFA